MFRSGKGSKGGIILLRKIEHTKEICKGAMVENKGASSPREEVGATKLMASMEGCGLL
jgi:hypothetical protein